MEPIVKLSHFEATLLFALFSSIVLGVVSKKSDSERVATGLRRLAGTWQPCSGWAG